MAFLAIARLWGQHAAGSQSTQESSTPGMLVSRRQCQRVANWSIDGLRGQARRWDLVSWGLRLAVRPPQKDGSAGDWSGSSPGYAGLWLAPVQAVVSCHGSMMEIPVSVKSLVLRVARVAA